MEELHGIWRGFLETVNFFSIRGAFTATEVGTELRQVVDVDKIQNEITEIIASGLAGSPMCDYYAETKDLMGYQEFRSCINLATSKRKIRVPDGEESETFVIYVCDDHKDVPNSAFYWMF